MSFAFPEIDPNTSGTVTHVSVPLGRYLGESFAAGQHDTVLNSLNRISEFNVADDDLDSPILDAKTANEKWGVGNLKFTEPVRESTARLMNQRKRDEMDREFFLSQGSSAGRFLPGMAASMLGAVSNPLDLGLMFVPFVGEEAAAAKATTVFGRMAARRLVTREALQAAFPAAPRLTEAVINGMVGQTLFEIPNIVASAQDQANYGPKQAAFNILTGGAFAAAMHGLGVVMQRLGRGTREEMARQALNQMLRDETVKVHQYVSVDEGAILEKLKFDADASRSAAYANINMDDIAKAVREQYGERVASPAIKMVDGTIRTGPSHEDTISAYWKEIGVKDDATINDISPEQKEKLRLEEEGFVTDKGRFISREEAGKLVGLHDVGYNHLMHENDKLLSEQISTANPEQLGAAEFDRYNQLIEENPQLSKVDALKKIVEEREGRRNRYLMEQPHIQELVERERQRAIEAFIEAERQKHEQTKKSRFDAMKQAEIERQIAEGRILKPEEIQKSTPSEKFDGSTDADLQFEIDGLKQDLKLEEMGMKSDMSGFKSEDDAIRAAVDCILKKVI